jgi:hypothetical protein
VSMLSVEDVVASMSRGIGEDHLLGRLRAAVRREFPGASSERVTAAVNALVAALHDSSGAGRRDTVMRVEEDLVAAMSGEIQDQLRLDGFWPVAELFAKVRADIGPRWRPHDDVKPPIYALRRCFERALCTLERQKILTVERGEHGCPVWVSPVLTP